MSVTEKSVKEKCSSVLMEGVLEKLKEREFPWFLSGRKLSTTWVLRYYVLLHADISDPDAFLLEQHGDSRPLSKIRKTLDLRRVVQVDTNISLKVSTQNWILAIHYKSRGGGKLKVIYLAARNEEEMNLWITKLCYACKLEKQDDEDVSSPSALNDNEDESLVLVNSKRIMPRSSVHSKFGQLESSRLSNNNFTSNGSYANPLSTHAYIRLKDCSSARSLGSSSASLSSSVTTSSSTNLEHCTSECVSIKNFLSIPPPIPPKPKPTTRVKKDEDHNDESGGSILNQALSPPDFSEVFNAKEETWSNETVRPHITKLNGTNAVSSSNCIATPATSDPSVHIPLPPRRNYQNIPPEIDRSCKPVMKNRSGHASIIQEEHWKSNACAASLHVFPTVPSLQQCRLPVLSNNKQIPVGIYKEGMYGDGLVGTTNGGGVLDYLDPLREALTESSLFLKTSQRPKTLCATEYTQIDEESTKAVLEANVRQDEIRRNGFSV